MSKNNFPLPSLLACAPCPPIGGQAVMDGVMMRNGDSYGLAVRLANGEILALRQPWKSLADSAFLRLPFVRGFPVLLETLINGIQALNISVSLAAGEGEKGEMSAWGLALSLGLALLMATGLFVLTPHLLSLAMFALGLGDDVDGFSFHIWDGFYKCAIFIAYIWLISLVPDIRRLFQYHGAEHKTIHAWERSGEMSAGLACGMSRLHPRCGTTFLLFVICISIILQAVLVPLFLHNLPAIGFWGRHAASLSFKLLLVIPISAISYELIRFAARLPEGWLSRALQAPGMALQRLTTSEPTEAQVEVAIVALAQSLGLDVCPGARPEGLSARLYE